MQTPPLVVKCERIGRKSAYSVSFQYDEGLIKMIKDLDHDERLWSPDTKSWIIRTTALLELIKKFTKASPIYFDFGNSREVFIAQIKKIEHEKAERNKVTNDLNENKIAWVKYKDELEISYSEHIDKMHTYLKFDSIKLYPHQIIAALFINQTRNTLISHEMGTGKTITSILYAEMNKFEKVMVITPNSLKFNFYYEVEKFTNSKAHVIGWGGVKGKKNKYTIEESKYIIVNYDYFNPGDKKKFDEKWKKLNIGKIDAVIADECQKLKNIKLKYIQEF